MGKGSGGRLQPRVGGGYVYEREGKVSGWKTSLLVGVSNRGHNEAGGITGNNECKCNMEIQ